MCGIAGLAAGPDDAGAVAQLLDALRARGPDAAGSRRVAGWQLASTRLAVVDLSARVRYPMANETGDLWLVFNGEIYNHRELRIELERHGHRFATGCDAEVVVHGYEQWDVEVFARLNGMWALALADERSGSLLLARDAFGIKPLVRTTRGRFAFASHAYALVAAGLARGDVDREAIDEFLAFHYVPEPRTGFAGVEQLPAGTWLRCEAGGAQHSGRWARPVAFEASADSVSAADADRAVSAAVRRQLAADVQVGVLLSGGVDSALVLAYAVQAGQRPQAFTLGFGGHGDYDESPAAARLAASLGVAHHVEQFGESFADSVTAVAAAYDSPFADPSAIATLPLARLAREHVCVVLSGTGGDDLFAGYRRHRAARLLPVAGAIPPPLRRWAAGARSERGAERRTVARQVRSYAVRAGRLAQQPANERYLSLVGSSTGRHALSALTWTPNLAGARARVATRHGLDGRLTGDLGHLQRFEIATYLSGDLLTKEDRATMAYGLEGRVPLLDGEVVALAQRTPQRQRATLRGGKLLLHELARRRLPSRPRAGKRGFAVPLGALLAGPWRADARAWIADGSSELVDRSRAAALVACPDTPPLDVWALCALLAWEERTARLRR